MSDTDFYIRYYVGHKGKFGHEFLEFEFRPDGKMRYANNSNYKNDTMIRKEAYVNRCVLSELKRIIEDFEILKEDDNCGPVQIVLDVKSLKSSLEKTIFHSQHQKLDLSLMSTNVKIQKASEHSTALFRI